MASAQADVIKKATPLTSDPNATSKNLDPAKLKEAEELAEKEKRDPVPATSVGWKQIGEWEEKDSLTLDDELMDLATPTLLDSYLPDHLYGDWFHSVGLLIGAGLLSWIVGRFNFSIAPVFFITLAASVYYRASIKKYRGVVRDGLQREFTIKHVENDYETMDWLNTFLDKYWIYLEPSVSQIVTEQVNPILASNEGIPPFVSAIWIDQFTAGIKPPRIDFVKTLDIPKDDVVVMDWSFSFTPHATADSSAKQLKNYVNQRVVVKATLFGITIPVVVENVAFKAWARVRIRMTTKFPHFETVNVQMMEPPQFDFISKLLGESIFNWEVLSFPGLYPFINEMIKKFAGPMVFQPFSFQLNVPQLLSGSNTSIGILALRIKSAKGLKAADRVLGNTVDPYLTFNFYGKEVLAKTKTILDTLTPTWNETVFVLVGSFTEPLIITGYDWNEDRKDKNIGSLQIDLNDVSDKRNAKNQVGQFLRNNKPCGELLYDYEFFPTLEESTLPDGSTEPPPDLNTGLAKIELSEVRNIRNDGKLSSYTELYFNNELVKTTPVSKNTDNPTFSIPFETIITDRRKSRIKVLVKDPKGKLISASIQTLNDLIDRTEIDSEWIPFSKGDGEFKITTNYKSVSLRDAPGAGGYTEPIGVVRVLLNKGEGLRNLEKIGKSDPYARLLVNGKIRARTDFIPDSLDPVWDEALYVPVTSPNQKLTIEVMDAEKNKNDRTLGSFNVKTNDIIERGEDDKYVEFVDKELRTGRLVHKKGPKGTVTYALSFYPITPVKTLEDIKEEQEAKDKKEAEKLKKAEEEAKSGKKPESKPSSKDSSDSKNAEETVEEDEDFNETNKIQLSLPELLTYNTGVFVFTVLSGDYSSTNSYLQVFLNGHGHPDHVSPEVKTKKVTSPFSGDALVPELEWANVTFRLVKDAKNNREDESIAESTLPVLSLLKNSYHEPQTLTLTGMGTNKLLIQTQWLPVEVSKLPPADLITNSGQLSLEIISANNLLSADSNGKSDPFIKAYLPQEEDPFYKTKTIKKTLDPVWNEKTNLEITNRVNTVIDFRIADWDFGAGQDDKLGDAYFDLADIDPINPAEYDVPVKGPKGEDGGVLHVKTSFRPGYIVKVNSQSTNIGAAGLNAVGSGIGAGIGAGGKVVGGVAGGVGGGLGKVKGAIFGKKKGGDE
ncbi:Tricalbin-2 [Wickerhamomyces ciferrii]|uniref:Tricalbin-2 n=1 Tax=Wickerhamomyces ciferrii (strain ATCC 14091 / BCRC 22168 / CBS 111 / JCM 3599 / NBRC 0793 / NRRL Y-1031 F-60-10) TaxID=1206466 RepID=K0KQ54_WICCF|nr:Tricalbin-2 [Wickerhamomyces ciferrii]CCH45176.1 Tricalbin-2 [Wickerhamomyces ciferrii]